MSNEDIEKAILKSLSDGAIENTRSFADSMKFNHDAVVGVMKSLQAAFYAEAEQTEVQAWDITSEALKIIENGSPEYQVYKLIPGEGISLAQLTTLGGEKIGAAEYKLGYGNCMKLKWVSVDKASGLVKPTGSSVNDDAQEALKALKASGCSVSFLDPKSKEADNMKRRNFIKLIKLNHFKITKGPQFSTSRETLNATITKEMLVNDGWKTAQFKSLTLKSLGLPTNGGYLHPLLKVRTEFRKILLSMGFSEMPTNQFVESSFWNFDSLFQPQSHPARDAHDTFFISKPATTLEVPEDYLERVKTIHEKGGFESLGYNYEWKREEAMKNLLRTHTTATSSQMLYKLATQEGGFKPVKYFSIDRVFRNETVDATHLAEFHQVELFVADRNLTLGNLIGMIYTFFQSIGITQLRFKPAYNPYTEPSMEIFGYHPDLKKWTEIGNSGIFRPEMIRPMGLPADVSVIACGLSVERPTMIKYRIKKIKELFGHKCDIKRTRSAPIARFP